MLNLPPPLRQEVLDDAAQRVARGGIQNPLAYLLATLRKAQEGEFNRKRTAITVLTNGGYLVGSTMRHGSSSLTRFTGQSAMTSRIW